MSISANSWPIHRYPETLWCIGGWIDGSTIERTFYFSREPGFSSQVPHNSLKPPFQGAWCPPVCFTVCMGYTHEHLAQIHNHKIHKYFKQNGCDCPYGHIEFSRKYSQTCTVYEYMHWSFSHILAHLHRKSITVNMNGLALFFINIGKGQKILLI